MFGHDASAFFYRDNFVDRHAREPVDLAAGPSNFQRIDFRAAAETEMDARIAGGHVTHAPFGLLDVRDAFGGQLE